MKRNKKNHYIIYMVWGLFIALIFYHAVDAWQTYLLLETDLIYEANPIFNYFIENMGFWVAACVYKGIIIIFTAITIIVCQNADKRVLYNNQ
ncbi:MAG: DUF5658 family protein [Candidatus Woesearchaeota archaeon]